MDFEIRADGSLHIEGYVNAVERDSRAVVCPECGKCVEQIAAGAFGEALRAAPDVAMLVNHDKGRRIGSLSEGNLTLYEDNIGLRAAAEITDSEVIEKARRGLLRGWSFGFKARNTDIERRAGNLPRRRVKALDIYEVSIIDDRFSPCYAGTSIEMRAGNEELMEMRSENIVGNVSGLSEYIGRYNRIVLNEYRLRAKMPGVLPHSEEQRGNGRNYIKLDNGLLHGSRPSGNSDNNSSGKHLTNGAKSGKINVTNEQIRDFRDSVKGAKDMNGIVISDVSKHAAERMIERGFTGKQVADSINTARIVYPGNQPHSHCVQIGTECRLVYSDSGRLITVITLEEESQ